MAAIDAAIERCEEMLSASLLGGATGEGVAAASGGVLVSRTDPDDPWANEVTLPPWVEKRRCPTTGYWMTAPFESQCPMPEVFKGDTTYLKLLNPIIGAVADANEAAAQPKAEKKEKPKKEKKAAPPPADDDPIELFGKVRSRKARPCEPASARPSRDYSFIVTRCGAWLFSFSPGTYDANSAE